MQILVPDLLMTVVPQDVAAQNSHKQDTYDDGNQTQVTCDIHTNIHDTGNAADAQHCPGYNYQQMSQKAT
jgi:hypothetical protein